MAREHPDEERHSRHTLRRAGWGMVSALIGLALVSAMLAVAHGRTPELEKALFQLGLGATALLAAVGQVLILGGFALLRSALRQRR